MNFVIEHLSKHFEKRKSCGTSVLPLKAEDLRPSWTERCR